MANRKRKKTGLAASQNLPSNYQLKTNLPGPELLEILRDSRIYVHLMGVNTSARQHRRGLSKRLRQQSFITAGGMKEFIPDEYRWDTYYDLKEDQRYIDQDNIWEIKRKQLWNSIQVLNPKRSRRIWSALQTLRNMRCAS